MVCNESAMTAMPTPSQSSDEDMRLSIDIPSTLDAVSVCNVFADEKRDYVIDCYQGSTD